MSAMLLYIITNENIPQALADWMLGHGLGMIVFLLVVSHYPPFSLWFPRMLGMMWRPDL